MTAAVETAFAELLAEAVGADRVGVDSDVFDQLGADSLVMARFCALVRKRPDLPPVSMRDVYRHRTVRGLAAALPGSTPVPETTADPQPVPRTRGGEYVACGALQLMVFLVYTGLAWYAVVRGLSWVAAGSGTADTYLRAALAGAAIFGGMCAVPVLAKWVLVGRWTSREIRIWSPAYVRFWTVRTLVRTSPMQMFVGTPLYPVYLRALGAKVGRGVLYLSRHAPMCTDLLRIGDHAVVRKDVYLTGYRAESGVIRTGTVTLGTRSVVGEAAVLDVDTALGDGAGLGRSSSLQTGQQVPDGEQWHGSPAQPHTRLGHRGVSPVVLRRWRPAAYCAWRLMALLSLQLPLAVGGTVLLVAEVPQLAALVDSHPASLTDWPFVRDALVASLALLVGLVVVGLAVVTVVPRLLYLGLEPGRTYPLYGLRYGLHRAIGRLTNVAFFQRLFGDSSYVVHYLRLLGYDLSRYEQTGSNFGLEVKHDVPYLCTVGRGTVAADGLSLLNAEYSSTSFRLARSSVGASNYLGNYVVHPPDAATGDNCLLATKVAVPVGTPLQHDVGLLGSPAFEIPRTVRRDAGFDHLRVGAEGRRRLAAKNRHNAVTIALFLVATWVRLCLVTLLGWAAVDRYHAYGPGVLAVASLLLLVLGVGWRVLVERAATEFGLMRPRNCSIYDPYFWWHERTWKLDVQPAVLDGTPFKNLVWRLLGVRIGRRVFDDGCAVLDKTLVTIGDDCALNQGSVIQPHSQEDFAFKSDRISIGSGCTVGVGALVHYGAAMGSGAVLAADSFLMKGEDVPPHSRWAGNPARVTTSTPAEVSR